MELETQRLEESRDLLEDGPKPVPTLASCQKVKKWTLGIVIGAAFLVLCRYAGSLNLFSTSSAASVAMLSEENEEIVGKCAGSIPVEGTAANIQVVSAVWNVPGDEAAPVRALGSAISVPLTSRAYFGTSCSTAEYNPKEYFAQNLLGKQLMFSIDLSSAGCGCNAAFYLTSMAYVEKETDCKDYYCDAMSVCGVRCPEIDIMEANKHAFRSTLHDGISNQELPTGGFGGGGKHWVGPRDWSSEQYGPGARCIDTNNPFQVAARFPVDMYGKLAGMEVVLLQLSAQRNCELLVDISEYKDPETGDDMLHLLGKTLQAGMTPIVSYWKSRTMTWLDGHGPDEVGSGLCEKSEDEEPQCSDILGRQEVEFSFFSITDLVA